MSGGSRVAALGCGVVPLGLLGWVTIGNLAAGRWLMAAVVLVPLAGALLSLLDGPTRRAFLTLLGELGLGLLGGEVEHTTEALPEGRVLRIATRLGRARVTRHLVVWSQVVDVRATTGQGGGLLVLIEQIDGTMVFFDAATPDAQAALLARVEGWRRDAALADPPGERCALCHVPLALERARCAGCGTQSHPSCSESFGACPTLGCAAGPPATARDAPLLDVTEPVSWGERVGGATLVACSALALALVLTAGANLLPGALLGALCLWALASLGADLGVLLLGARRVVVRSGEDLDVRLARGRLSLRLWRIPLAAIARVVAEESVLAGHVVRLHLAGVDRARLLARGMSAVAARRVEAVVLGWCGRSAVGAPGKEGRRLAAPKDTDPPSR